MAESTLSVFIDESGDFGAYNHHSPNYFVTMVLHDQKVDISSEIESMEVRMNQAGYPHHAVHVGPLIRRESFYRKWRKAPCFSYGDISHTLFFRKKTSGDCIR